MKLAFLLLITATFMLDVTICHSATSIQLIATSSTSADKTEISPEHNKTDTSSRTETRLRISIGSNLDLKDNSVKGSFYGRASFYLDCFNEENSPKRKQKPNGNANAFNRFGLYVGFYANNFISQVVERSREGVFYSEPVLSDDGKVQTKRSFGFEKSTTATNNLAFFLSFPSILWHSTSGSSTLSASLLPVESIYQQVTTSYDYDTKDYQTVALDSLAQYNLLEQGTEYLRRRALTIQLFTTYLGFGSLDFSYRPDPKTVGIEAFVRIIPLGLRYTSGNFQSLPFANVYCMFTDSKSTGVRMGFDWRKDYTDGRHTFNVFIAKIFDLNNLGKFLGTQ
jgi:hypothetical protein